MKDVGRVFDRTLDHPIGRDDTSRFVEHYFPDGALADRDVLDAGCRLGDYSAAFLAAGARRVVGVDLARRAVAVASRRRRSPGLTFAAGDVRRLGFADDSFDVAVCASALSYLPPAAARRGLEELARVTRPGGELLLLFLRPQGWLLRLAQSVSNRVPMPVYALGVALASRLPTRLATPFLGRPIDAGRLRYLLWGLQGTHFGVPMAIPDRHRIETVETTDCSERTLISFRLPVPEDKSALRLPAAGRRMRSRDSGRATPAG